MAHILQLAIDHAFQKSEKIKPVTEKVQQIVNKIRGGWKTSSRFVFIQKELTSMAPLVVLPYDKTRWSSKFIMISNCLAINLADLLGLHTI